MNSRFTMVVAVHLILIKDKKILLSRRFNTGYEDGNFSVPAGHVEKGESCLNAMIREAKEEIDVEIKSNNLLLAHVMHRKTDRERIDFFFECKEWAGTPKINEKDKCDLLKWFEIGSFPHNTVPYVREAVTLFLNNEKYSEMGF